jgi:4-hydroxybenzoate polyprenyltransferase
MKAIIGFFRLDEWVRTAIIMAVCALLLGKYDSRIGIFMVFFLFLMSFGFILNSYCDRKEDHALGRKIYLYRFSRTGTIVIISFLFLGSLASAVFLPHMVFALASLLLAVAYSMKPVRLKVRGFVGLILLVICMLPLPFLAYAYPLHDRIGFILLVYLFAISLVQELAHQIGGRQGDSKFGLRTWAVTNVRLARSALIIGIVAIFIIPVLTFDLFSIVLLELLSYEVFYDSCQECNLDRKVQ